MMTSASGAARRVRVESAGRNLPVGGQQAHQLAARLGEARPLCGSVARISGQLHNLNDGQLARQPLCDLTRPVAAAIVNDDDLVRSRPCSQDSSDASHHALDGR